MKVAKLTGTASQPKCVEVAYVKIHVPLAIHVHEMRNVSLKTIGLFAAVPIIWSVIHLLTVIKVTLFIVNNIPISLINQIIS